MLDSQQIANIPRQPRVDNSSGFLGQARCQNRER